MWDVLLERRSSWWDGCPHWASVGLVAILPSAPEMQGVVDGRGSAGSFFLHPQTVLTLSLHQDQRYSEPSLGLEYCA